MKPQRVKVVTGSRDPVISATDNLRISLPKGTDPRMRACLRQVAKTAFLVVTAYHPELRRVIITVKAKNTPLNNGAAGTALYMETLSGLRRKSNGSIFIALPNCDLNCGHLCQAKESLSKVCKHEFAHLATRRCWASKKVPTWLEEGYAEWIAYGPSGETNALWMVSQSRIPFSVEDMDKTFGHIEPIHYRYFYLMCAFLSKRSGKRLSALVYGIRTMSWQKALKQIYGLTPEEMLEQFNRYLERGKRNATPNFLDSLINEVRGWIQL